MSLQFSTDEVSQTIKQEIMRFESVHPSIYAIYDLIDTVDDKTISESLRQLVVSIEDAFVNSQEWTLNHDVPDIRLGLLGSVHSGKSALVHRYLTGAYVHDESPEGGRYKKEVSLDNQSYLLLIRDEGGPPDQQFSHWIDGVIFVFSLESFDSYQMVYDYYSRLSEFRNTSNLPIFLVGTQDSGREPYVRVVDDSHTRKLVSDLKRCAYYDTCAAYGLNVERVFQDACLKIIQSRLSCSDHFQRPTTLQLPLGVNHPLRGTTVVEVGANARNCSTQNTLNVNRADTTNMKLPATSAVSTGHLASEAREKFIHHSSVALPIASNAYRDESHVPIFETDVLEENSGGNNDLLTPTSTPTHSRKNWRKSNLFVKKSDDDKDREKKVIGVGRAIPLKQGYLYKRTCKPLNKEWKTKKYVTLTDDARLTYHPSIHDYMENTHGKEIDLSRTTVKIPGIAYRHAGVQIISNGLLGSQSKSNCKDKQFKVISSSPSILKHSEPPAASNGVSTSSTVKDAFKKRNRRTKCTPKIQALDGYDSEGFEFQLISVNRQWNFEANGLEDRDEWVMHIERAIMTRLQLNESSKRSRANVTHSLAGIVSNVINSTNLGQFSSGNHRSVGNTGGSRRTAGEQDHNNESSIGSSSEHTVQNILAAAGNDFCADCGAPDPDWASLNLGAIVCIGCSGIHRQLGTHISRIRSLHLDDWSPESVVVMCAIGNTLANSVWEAAVPINAGNRKKPHPNSSREEKEVWIRAKYDHQEFLPPLPYPDAPLQQQLIDAIARQDTRQVVLCLALATPDTVNAPYSRQDPRAAIHIAATLGNLVYLQLLLWYNGDPNVTDHEGRNAFYYAHCSQKYECADFLLRSACEKQLVPRPQRPPPFSTLQHPQPAVLVPAASPSSITTASRTSLEGVNSTSTSAPFTVVGGGVSSQPHHFSNLQQQHIVSGTNVSPSVPLGVYPYIISSPVGSNLGPAIPQATALLLSNSSTTSTASGSGTMVYPTSATAVPYVTALHAPSGSREYPSAATNSANNVAGATLPRRRLPQPAAPVCTDRLTVPASAVSQSVPTGVASQQQHPNASSHMLYRYAPSANTQHSHLQYPMNNQEVGL